MKRCSISSVIREMQIITMIRYLCIPTRKTKEEDKGLMNIWDRALLHC